VPFSDLLAPEFYKQPDVLFSDDMFHPSAVGYALAASQLLPALCEALGECHIDGPPDRALRTRAADVSTLLAKVAGVTRLWRRTTGVPAPVVASAS
jgi:hypothetical protein